MSYTVLIIMSYYWLDYCLFLEEKGNNSIGSRLHRMEDKVGIVQISVIMQHKWIWLCLLKGCMTYLWRCYCHFKYKAAHLIVLQGENRHCKTVFLCAFRWCVYIAPFYLNGIEALYSVDTLVSSRWHLHAVGTRCYARRQACNSFTH